MKTFFVPLLVIFALPTAINAESYWLILRDRTRGGGVGLEKIEMSSNEKCENQIDKLINQWIIKEIHLQRRFAFIVGK